MDVMWFRCGSRTSGDLYALHVRGEGSTSVGVNVSDSRMKRIVMFSHLPAESAASLAHCSLPNSLAITRLQTRVSPNLPPSPRHTPTKGGSLSPGSLFSQRLFNKSPLEVTSRAGQWFTAL